MLYNMINKNAQIIFNGVSDTGNMSHYTTHFVVVLFRVVAHISMQDMLMQMKNRKETLTIS